MKKLFLKFHWLLLLLPVLAWAGHEGSSTQGKEATVSWSYTLACDSAWMVFGYDGDAGDPDSANMYDSLKLVQCFSGTGKELCGDGLDLDSIGSHVVRMYCFSGDAVIGIRVGKWEQKKDMGDTLNLIMTKLDSSLVLSENLAHFYGACDLCYEIHFPPDGTANKDSSYLINPGLSGSDTLVAKVEFKHSNVEDVADSSYYYLNPWW